MPRRPILLLRRSRRGRLRPPGPYLVSVLLACALLALAITAVNGRIRPILTAMATAGVSNAVTAAINDAISDGIAAEHISYGDMIAMETDGAGRVSVLTSNLEEINRLRAQLLARVLEAVSALSEEEFAIPLGNLAEVDLLSGLGPDVRIRVLSTGAASADIAHAFTGAGVNQTLHQIMLDIEVIMQILLPGETIELPVSTRVCVAETIIVGEVPDTYLDWEG